MDQTLVDITHIANVEMGSVVFILDDEYNADKMASGLNTIGYEIICGISKRVQRY